MICETISSVNNFISDSNMDEILREVGPIFLKDIKTITDAMRSMHIHKYKDVFFDLYKTIILPPVTPQSECQSYDYYANQGLLTFDSDTGLYVYNYDGLFPTYADIITNIKSDITVKEDTFGALCDTFGARCDTSPRGGLREVKLKYNGNLSNINDDFKLYNFLSPFNIKSLNFYFDESVTGQDKEIELNFSMRCYILSDKVKEIFYRQNLIKTISHVYKNGQMFPL